MPLILTLLLKAYWFDWDNLPKLKIAQLIFTRCLSVEFLAPKLLDRGSKVDG